MADTPTLKCNILSYVSIFLATAAIILVLTVRGQNSRILERIRRIECANNISALVQAGLAYSAEAPKLSATPPPTKESD